MDIPPPLVLYRHIYVISHSASYRAIVAQWQCPLRTTRTLRWAKSRDGFRRIARESYWGDWWSYLPPNHRDRPPETLRLLSCDSDGAIGIRSCNIKFSSTWKCCAEWPARVYSIRWTLAVGDLRFCHTIGKIRCWACTGPGIFFPQTPLCLGSQNYHPIFRCMHTSK